MEVNLLKTFEPLLARVLWLRHRSRRGRHPLEPVKSATRSLWLSRPLVSTHRSFGRILHER